MKFDVLYVDNGDELLPLTIVAFNTNAYLLLFSAIFLILFGLYAGLLYPYLRKKYQLHTYSIQQVGTPFSRWASLGCAVVTLVLCLAIGDYSSPKAFVRSLWEASKFWDNQKDMRPPTILTIYCYGFVAFNFVIAVVFYLLLRSKRVTKAEWDSVKGDVEKPRRLARHGFLIAAHNSADRIAPCLDAVLELVEPHQIYVMDNGSSKVEEEKLVKVCKEISDAYCLAKGDKSCSSQINVAHLSNYGSKALAQYACVYHLSKTFKEKTNEIDIVTLIDDDVIVDSEWNYKEVDRLFDDESTVALAYGIRASNHEMNLCTAFQDLEYICGNVGRYMQELLGSQLFASGAIATWRVETLLHVLDRHPTHFNGEDLEFGLILAMLSDEMSTKLGVDTQVKMGFYADCVMGTDVPPHFYHWYDFFPKDLFRYWKITRCECGEHSLFNQRFRSWDPPTHQYIWKYMKVVFSPRGLFSRGKFATRIICFWRIIDMIFVYLAFGGFIGMCIGFIPKKMFAAIGAMMVNGWTMTVVSLLFFSISMAPMQCSFSPDVLLLYPLLFSTPQIMILRFISIPYFLCYYLWFVPFPKQLRVQMQNDPKLQKALWNCWEKQPVSSSASDTLDSNEDTRVETNSECGYDSDAVSCFSDSLEDGLLSHQQLPKILSVG